MGDTLAHMMGGIAGLVAASRDWWFTAVRSTAYRVWVRHVWLLRSLASAVGRQYSACASQSVQPS
jgi:hypothetical protein